MTTYEKGDNFEEYVFNLFKKMLEDNEISYANPNHSKIFKQKAYYSRDRESDIKIDVSIEVYYAGTNEIALLIPIECKNHERSIEVGKVEEFINKVGQITRKGTKAIFVSTSSYSKGAFNVAKNKGLALLRVLPSDKVEWRNYRMLPDEIDMMMRLKYTSREIKKAMTEEKYIGEENYIFGNIRGNWKIGDDAILSALRGS